MPTWIWLTLVVALDAVVWGFLLHRERARARVHRLQLREIKTRLQEALEAPKGVRPRLLEGVMRSLERHADQHPIERETDQ